MVEAKMVEARMAEAQYKKNARWSHVPVYNGSRYHDDSHQGGLLSMATATQVLYSN